MRGYCNGYYYSVQPGDTLYGISRRNNVSIADLINANSELDVYNLYTGMRLCIPVYQNIKVVPIPVPVMPPVWGGPGPEGPGHGGPGHGGPGHGGPGHGGPGHGGPGHGGPGHGGPGHGGPGHGGPGHGGPGHGGPGGPRRIYAQEMKEQEQVQMTQSNDMEEDRDEFVIPVYPDQQIVRKEVEQEKTSVVSYVVKKGDSLQGVLERFELNFDDLVQYNDLSQVFLAEGKVIHVPNHVTMDDAKWED